MSSKEQNTPNEQVSDEIQQEQQQPEAETATEVDPRDERIAQLEAELAQAQGGDVLDLYRWTLDVQTSTHPVLVADSRVDGMPDWARMLWLPFDSARLFAAMQR